MNKKFKHQKGQVGLVTLLVMTVMLSVGISVVNRSTEDLRITRQEEDASRVFSAAETGIEAGLSDLSVGQGSLEIGQLGDQEIPISVDYVVEERSEFEAVVEENDTISLDVSNASGGENILIEWARNQDCVAGAAAVEVIIFNKAQNTARREGYDRCEITHNNNFVVASGGSDGYYAQSLIGLLSGDELVRVKVLYEDSEVKVGGVGGYSISKASYRIKSTASSDVGDEIKTVEVSRSISGLPSVFDYVLYSGGSLTK